MIAVDTNILVYAHRAEMHWHGTAAQRLSDLAGSATRWAIPWPCVHEFLAKVTRPRIFDPPSSTEKAVGFIDALASAPNAEFLVEGDDHLSILARLMREGRVSDGRVHDARIADICIANGVTQFWTADRDFGRFPELSTVNPLVGPVGRRR